MLLDDLRLWFWIIFAIGMGVALVVRGLRRGAGASGAPSTEDRDHVVRARRPPRPQHHAFAHVLLRDRALEDPGGTFDAATLPGCGDFLVGLWLAAGGAEEALLSPEGLRVDVDGDIALVILPPPARINEAYMVAIVREHGAYFVLEKGEHTPFLAEWRLDVRLPMGEVSAPTKRAFLASIRAELAGRSPSAPCNADSAPGSIVCCPYCITPLDETDGSCPTCGRDTANDALVEYTEGSYELAPRRRCTACGAAALEIAVTCPSCRASLPVPLSPSRA